MILLNTLIVVSLGLIPMASTTWYGITVLTVGLIFWAAVLYLGLGPKAVRNPDRSGELRPQVVAMQLATAPYVVAGVLLLTVGDAGVYFIAFGALASYAVAIATAWVLMVEIRR